MLHPPRLARSFPRCALGWVGVFTLFAATSSSASNLPRLERDRVPPSIQPCMICHEPQVAEYLRTHAMARSIGTVGDPGNGEVVNPQSGTRYQIIGGAEPRLEATFADGGRRTQRLVGRIGGGVFDTSWVGTEVDSGSGRSTGHLFFAPVETITGQGFELSPFELEEHSAGLDLALTEGCLTCHTDSSLAELPGAATANGATHRVFPAHALGADAFEHLEPIGCNGCHGDASDHLERVSGEVETNNGGEVGLPRLSELAPAAQRDVCARCHLQGDARIDLGSGLPQIGGDPLAGRIPVLVPRSDDDPDDFRFVGQSERLALSACFRATPEMTCNTCHLPHRGVRLQGTASFDQICAQCHPCVEKPGVQVSEVTGQPGRTEAACVDCHMRRSQPFDLPHVRAADHFIRRRIPPPRDDIPHRQFASREAPMKIFDDADRLAPLLRQPSGRRWRSGIHAMGLVSMGRVAEAIRHFDAFPPPGSSAARQPTASSGLTALENLPAFHEARALALVASGRLPEAQAAYSDALLLDPLSPSARLGRARIAFDSGNVPGALQDTQVVIENFTRAEQPWILRIEIAERLRRPELVIEALQAATHRWPSEPSNWYKLGLLLGQRGEDEGARAALDRARRLSPSIRLPGAGPISQHR